MSSGLSVAALFDAHHVALYQHLVRLTGDPDLAADAAQEAFVRLIDHLPRLGAAHRAATATPGPRDGRRDDPHDGTHDAARAWLYRVATNVALDHARTAARRRRLLATAGERAPMADPPPAADRAVEARERHAHVTAALATLSARDRAVLLLREAGFAHREIAEMVGTTTGAVGTLLARALTKLGARLAAAIPGGPEAL